MILNRSVKVWLRGLIAAAVGAGSNAITVMVVEPQHFNVDDGLTNVVKVALVSAVVGAALYLKQHPVPEDEDVDVVKAVS